MELYADIIVPVAHAPFTFRLSGDDAAVAEEGMGVRVTFREKKIYMGIIRRIHSEPPSFKVKDIDGILVPYRLVSSEQMKLWEWIAEYYMCTLGEVMRYALPAALKPSGNSPEEFSKGEYRPLKVRYVSFHPSVTDHEKLNEVCEGLRRSRAQYATAMELAGFLGENIFGGEIPLSRLSASRATLKKLVEKDIVTVTERDAAFERDGYDDLCFELPVLTPAQSAAREGIIRNFGSRDTVLLHGVTGSGKTEIYMHLIAEQLRMGKSVLYMMPEIVMTSQTISRIRAVFGDRVTVYHSMLSDRRRAEAYRRLSRSEGGELILGVRSSVLLPLPGLGLVIVDEEHDPSYKQSDNAPRYNARDCAVVISRLWGAKCLTASATPSIESYTNSLKGKYGLVTLTERYGDARLPRVIISDTLAAVKRGERKSHFNKILLDAMRETLAEGGQVMLFQNRRGFSPYVECTACGHAARCRRCSTALSYHKGRNALRCHICGYSEPMPALCPDCGKASLKPQGFGTEKVEEELAVLFPDARVTRLDRDVATTQKKYEAVIGAFERGDTDILVGTQMVTKGFDFPKLSLVGILNADNLLNYPDFRASERAYQLMTQVAGRAGRTDEKGRVIIQTSQPDNDVIRQVQALDYEGMVRMQLAERKVFGYPPYGRLVSVTLKHYKYELAEEGAENFAARMRAAFGERVYGPHAPVLEKISNEHYFTVLLKIEAGMSFAEAKAILEDITEKFGRDPSYRRISVSCNVDPQ